MRFTRRAFLRIAGVVFTLPIVTFRGRAAGLEEWSAPMSEAQMLIVVGDFVPGRGRYRFEGQTYSQWFTHKRLLRKLRDVFPQIPLLQPLLQVQRESDSEFIEIQRVSA